jgi:hypothetical protein
MPRQEAEKAIENFCTHSNEIIFSSIPFDYKEATHINVHDPEYWAEQFARYGFFRDMEADLSCITSWAVRFIKTKRTGIKLVREYERKFWQLTKENFDLRQLSLEMQDRLSQLDKQVQTFGVQVAEKEQAMAVVTAQMTEITGSKAWKIALLFRRIRILLAPPNSRRARALRRLKDIFSFAARILKHK